MQEARLEPGASFLEDGAVLDEIAAGVHDAGNPYFDWLFGGPEAARAALRAWVRRPTSEVYAGRARLLLEGGALAGGVVGMPGRTCNACRMADAAALLSLARGPARAAMLARLAASTGLFSPVRDDEWYASKLWVRPEFRGRGYAGLLTRAVFHPPDPPPGRRLGDVWAGNATALRVYERAGLRVVQRNTSPSGLEYVVVVLGEGA